MFTVTFEDGTQVTEHDNVAFWDQVPKDRKVTAVALSDGHNLVDVIEGADVYVCFYEASTTLSMQQSIEQGGQRGKTYAQRVVGLRTTNQVMARASQIQNRIIQDIKNHYPQASQDRNLTTEANWVQLRTDKLEEAARRFDALIQKLGDVTMEILSLEIRRTFGNRKDNKQGEDGFRQGIQEDWGPSNHVIEEHLKGVTNAHRIQ